MGLRKSLDDDVQRNLQELNVIVWGGRPWRSVQTFGFGESAAFEGTRAGVNIYGQHYLRSECDKTRGSRAVNIKISERCGLPDTYLYLENCAGHEA